MYPSVSALVLATRGLGQRVRKSDGMSHGQELKEEVQPRRTVQLASSAHVEQGWRKYVGCCKCNRKLAYAIKRCKSMAVW